MHERRRHAARRAAAVAGLALVVVASSLGAIPTPARAADWRITPRFSAEGTLSDNIDLDPSASARSDFVTLLTPGVGIRGQGGRLDLFFDVQATMKHYVDGSDDSGIDPRLQSNATAELVDDVLFLDLNGVVGQRNSDSAGRLSSDLVNVNDNRRDFSSFGASPYVRWRFGSAADAEVRYRIDQVNNEEGGNTTLQELSVAVIGSTAARLPWTLTANSREEDNSDGVTSTFRDIDGSLSYAFSPHYSARVNAGYERNDFRTVRTDANGFTWRISGIWTPSERTSLEVGYGSRFFGSFPSLSLSHRMRRVVITASYVEEETTSALEQARGVLFPLADAFGDPIENPGAQRVDIPTNTLPVSDNVLVSRNFRFGLAYRGRRSDASASAFSSERSTESGLQGDENVYGLSVDAARRLSRRTRLSAFASWQRSELSSGIDATLWALALQGSYQLNKDVSANVSVRHARNDSDDAASEYTENRVTASVNVLF